MPRSALLSGLYPRRESLVKATWDADKGLLDAKALDAAFLDAAKEVLALQERLGFTTVTDGNLTWQDPFRGLVASTTGFQVGGVTRFFETNKFYRQPILTGRPLLRGEDFAQHFLLDRLKVRGEKAALLPSPYWLVRAAKIETPANAPEDALVATLVNEAAKWLAAQDYTSIQLQEPLLFHEKGPDLDLALDLLKAALKGVHATTTVKFSNGNAAPHWDWAAKVPADWVGIDFTETHTADLRANKAKWSLQAAVVDSQETLLESPQEVAATVDAIGKRLQPKGLALTHTWELDFQPAEAAPRKLEALTLATQKAVVA